MTMIPSPVIHLGVVHGPIVLMPTAAALFAATLLGAGRGVRLVALALVAVSVGLTAVAYLTGPETAAMRSNDRLASQDGLTNTTREGTTPDEAAPDWIAAHARAAGFAVPVVVVAGAGIVGLFLAAESRPRRTAPGRRMGRTGWATSADVAAIVLALVASAALIWTGHLGGAIQHAQVRGLFGGETVP